MRGVSLQLAITTHLMEIGELPATTEEIAYRKAKIERLRNDHDAWRAQPADVRAQQLLAATNKY